MPVQKRRKRRSPPAANPAPASGRRRVIFWACGSVLAPLLVGIPAFLQSASGTDQARPPGLFQDQRKILYTGRGTIFAVDRDGVLRRFQHTGYENGEKRWSTPPGVKVGEGWQRYVWLVSGNPGTLYAVDAEGRMFLFDDLSQEMDPDDGKFVKAGLPEFKSFTGAYDVFYGLREDGGICWFRHLGGAEWTSPDCTLVKTGMRGYDRLVATGHGVVFAVTAAGDLRWFRHLNSTLGGSSWEGDHLAPNATGWSGFLDVTSLNGVVYALDQDYALRWYRYDIPQVYKRGGSGWRGGGPQFPATGMTR
ncbi:hypothetical protein Aph01nite_58920 [Acrocarpospora phusangensis]|uniref:Tachylectin 2 domain-containing protein n=1 Tax=Acrocarpospora phusangensis TaxID=1070424 RepID=A0A919QJZ5_9ACTN|nr:tachylectin-related carbohydrate-binding protein [Acrocarpospora phusangensis]GIH27582.1 hypothetical protein Aph01nite_58920 [Acrocarpospora phusangensis]